MNQAIIWNEGLSGRSSYENLELELVKYLTRKRIEIRTQSIDEE